MQSTKKIEKLAKKLSSVEKGDKFENRAHGLIVKAIEDDKFAFPLKYARVKQKAKYYSKKIEKDIVFDLAIEIWPPEAKNYSNLFLIECKSYSSKKVPIGDLRKFIHDVNDVAELNGKAVFITDSSYTDPSITLAKNTGMMIITVDTDDSIDILLYKKNRIKNIDKELNKIQKQFENFITAVFNSPKITGLKKLSASSIERIANKILEEFNPNILKHYQKLNIEDFVDFFKEKYDLKFDFSKSLAENTSKETFGYFDVRNKEINIDRSIVNTDRFSFLLTHELGHFILHSKLKLNQKLYNEFEDSPYNIFTQKHTLKNDKHWVEWQANKFASSVLMPEKNIGLHLAFFQKSIGISKYGHVYLDHQKVNREDFKRITHYLSDHFNTSKTSVIYRLEELKLITYAAEKDEYKESLREHYKRKFDQY